jgi:hypothetical protein
VARLKTEQRAGLELRHLAVLLSGGDAAPDRDRAGLLQEVAAQIAAGTHQIPTLHPEAVATSGPKQAVSWQDKVSWADLLTLHVLLDSLRDPTVTATLFAQADADLIDTSSEYGGVLELGDGRIRTLFCLPDQRGDDNRYVIAPATMERSYTALACYHFHAQRYVNGQYAAPNPSELAEADHLEANQVLFTFIDPNWLHVCYYQPHGVVVDLGDIHR